MHARKRFDIGSLDLSAALWACAFARDRRATAARIEAWFSPTGDALACLSVRTALDLYLEALELPPGSEVLMSALTIPDMWRIVERHGLVPVPVDVDPQTLAPRLELMRANASERTRVVLIAHLFGTRIPLAPITALARERGWLVVEDCAQAFTGPDYKGDPASDVALFSFGPIKTATALAGAVACVRDRRMLEKMRAGHARLPVQTPATFARRILKYAGLRELTRPLVYAAFVRACALGGREVDRVIQGSVRGFAGGDLFQKIRHQPSAPLLALLLRRLELFDGTRVARRTRIAHEFLVHVPETIELPGAHAPFHSYWVFAILAGNRDELIAHMRRAGFDATAAASLACVPAPAGRPELEARDARHLLARLVYLPLNPELAPREVERLARVFNSASLGVRHARAGAKHVTRWA